MNKCVKIGLICFTIFYSAFLFADNVNPDANNQATVAVTDRSAPALQLAMQSAFSDVMAKMSNDPNVMAVPAVQKALANLTPWVQSYAYVEQPNISNPQATPTLMLQVVFDRAGLMALLKIKASVATQTKPITSSQQSTVSMIVSGVRNIADYMQVMRTLRDKNDVMRVSVGGMQSDHVLLRVKLVGSSAEFQKLMASDDHFKAAMDGAQSKQLDYYWMGNQA